MNKRAVISILFAIMTLVNSLMLFLAFSNFKSQQTVIAAKYCVNQERTDFDCGGQCYFMKKMAAAEQDNLPFQNSLKENLNFSPFIIEAIPGFLIFKGYQELVFFSREDNPPSTLLQEVFRPPQKPV